MEKIVQIYDKIFKRIITLSSPAIILFINKLFDKDFDLKAEITYNWTESVDDRLGKIVSDTIITVNSVFKFHMEVQISNDSTIALRMFEYEFKDAIKYKEIDSNRIILNLPEARIIYLEHTETTPDFVELVFNFQGQGVFEYRCKAEKLLNYTVEDLDKSGMVILLPLYILKLRRKINKSTTTKWKELALELKKLLENCIITIEANENKGGLTHDDVDVLINLLAILYKQLYGEYAEFKKEGVDTMLAERLVTYSEQKAEERTLQKTIDVAKKLILKGLNLNDISEVTGLDMKNIIKIQIELDK